MNAINLKFIFRCTITFGDINIRYILRLYMHHIVLIYLFIRTVPKLSISASI